MLKKLAASAVLIAAAGVAVAQKPVTIEELARLPDYEEPVASHDGRFLAVRIPVKGRMNLAVIDLESRTRTTLTDHTDADVIDHGWVGNNRIVYSTAPALAQGEENVGDARSALRTVTRDGSQRTLVFAPGTDSALPDRTPRSLRLLRSLPGTEVEALVIGNLNDPHANDIYRVNLDTGARVLLTADRPAGTLRYLLDADRVPRVVLAAVAGTTRRTIHFRARTDQPWREVARFDVTRPGAIYPLALTPDSRRMFVASNVDRANMAIYIFDPETGKLAKKIFEHPQLDFGFDPAGGRRYVGSAGIDRDTDEVWFEYTNVAKPEIKYALEDRRAFQRTIDRLLPGTYNDEDRLRGDRYLVSAVSSTWPESWHLFNEADRSMEDFIASRPWLAPDRLAPLRTFDLKTRDGLVIPSHYLLPTGAATGVRLPTVVLLQAWPGTRYVPGEFSEVTQQAQALAARGFAVVLSGRRGAPGFGNRIYYAGFGALGRKEADDAADAAAWAVNEGIADSARICVSGSAFGGHAALMALARHPKTFRCGAANAVVADLPLLLTSPASSWSARPNFVATVLARAGADKPAAIPVDASPANVAAQIKQPVLLHWDGATAAIPYEQTKRMVDALSKAGAALSASGPGAGTAARSIGDARAEGLAALLKFLESQIGTIPAR
jgi:dipeptidyl aminopeptidase/acylaminoacyl peptidase